MLGSVILELELCILHSNLGHQMGVQDRDYMIERQIEREKGAKRPGNGLRPLPIHVSVRRSVKPLASKSSPPDLDQVVSRWWFQVLIWLVIGLVLFELFRHLPKH
jgi:hypothetical protein